MLKLDAIWPRTSLALVTSNSRAWTTVLYRRKCYEIADLIGDFVTGSKAPIDADRVLATVLFTDIVGSTEKAAALGDRRWRDLLDNHNATIRRNIVRFRGRETNMTGDGFLIAFDGPARAVRCACAIADEIRPLGIDIRAGLHTGECEEIGENIGGIAVHIGARVAALAGPSQVRSRAP